MSDASSSCNREQSTLILDALGYASLGLPVIPLNGKTPFMERWPQRATTDPDQIKRWFTSWPNKNLGVVTGAGIIALDIDPRNGGRDSFRKLTRGRKMPATATALTGSRGNHYLFRVDPSRRFSCSILLPGIEVKGEGGQIVVEPSVHPRTGKDYVWLRTPRQGIAEAPKWLVEMLTEKQPPLACQKPLDLTRDGNPEELRIKAIQRFPVFRRGQRNDVMVRLIGSLLGRGYNPDLTLAVVGEWWHHYYRQGVVGTPPSEISLMAGAAIQSTIRSSRFTRAVGSDHRAEVAKIRLSETQKALIERLVTSPNLTEPSPHSNIVTHKRKQRVAHHERVFLEALIVYFTYKVVERRENPIRATNDQLRWRLEDGYGLKLSNVQFDRLVSRYISRADKPASRCELVIQTLKGRLNVPSRYELTGLKQFIPQISL